jgi:uncharacterized protein (DUF1800 family)
MQPSASLAISRFGLGAKPGELAAYETDPLGALLAQLDQPEAAPAGMSTSEAVMRFVNFAAQKHPLKGAASTENRKKGKGDKAAKGKRKREAGDAEANAAADNPVKAILLEERTAYLDHLITASSGFSEHIVMFWTNHFTVSARKQIVACASGAYVRDAIRPNALGKFAELLKAVVKHPAMLAFLDNNTSIGPDSRPGQRKQKGLNENLAREILELHTLGVDGGYTPGDVTGFANLLTGWSISGQQDPDGGGGFMFKEKTHQPGPISAFGKSWEKTGLKEGEEFLGFIATHPKTAHFISTKLVRHFVADQPPAEAVAAVEATFNATDGNLKACYKTLLECPAAWDVSRPKLKTPMEFLISSFRALQPKTLPHMPIQALLAMGQPLWAASSPKGWPDTASSWISSDAMKTRLDLASQLAAKATGPAKEDDPLMFAGSLLGDRLTDETSTAISRAADHKQALILLLMSPEFQRR